MPSYVPALLLLLLPVLVSTTNMNVPTTPKKFNLTAISAVDGKSTLECWQLVEPIAVSSSPGTVGTANQQLGNLSNASYTILPSRFDGGLHNAPAAQYAHTIFYRHKGVL